MVAKALINILKVKQNLKQENVLIFGLICERVKSYPNVVHLKPYRYPFL